MRILGPKGYALLKSDESLRLRTYDDMTGEIVEAGDDHPGTLSIGWGHTGLDVFPGETITPDQAAQLLNSDVNERLPLVDRLVTADVNQNQFDAVFCFAFNVGVENLAESTLLRKLNAGEYLWAAAEFPRWNQSGGHVMGGLVKRRADEVALFNTAV
jgi:lysozyme